MGSGLYLQEAFCLQEITVIAQTEKLMIKAFVV
jgi:hypothetical protein